jgi:ribonuclease-3
MSLAMIDVHDLLGHPGLARSYDLLGTIDGLATELVAVPDDAVLGGGLALESVIEGVFVTGSITGTWRVGCARCLTEQSQPFTVEIAELVTSTAIEPADAEDDGYVLVDEQLDVDQIVRDAVGVEMPFAPLCRPDCQGLCATCRGPVRSVARAPHDRRPGLAGHQEETRWQSRRRSKARPAPRSAVRRGRRPQPRTARVRNASSRSSRTTCAGTAGTTRAGRPSRSSSQVGSPEPASIDALDRALGVAFRDPGLREAALTHRSFAFEQGLDVTNERLEFLGDSVLGLIVTDMAYRSYPDLAEGQLAKLRAAIVNMHALADVARGLGIGDLVLLGKGEEGSGGRDKASILADALEAILGAVYLDRGLAPATELIERLFRPRMEAYVRGEGDRDFKTALQELASQRQRALPAYEVEESGPDHQKEFTATVSVAGERLGAGAGRTKKEAEQHAAREAYERLRGRVDGEPSEEGRWSFPKSR